MESEKIKFHPSLAPLFASNVNDAMRDVLAEELGVTADAIKRLGVGFYPAEQCWTFPERNAKGEVVGIMRRYGNGKKFVIKGSKRGLTYEYQSKGHTRYLPGEHNWVRATKEDPCPLCHKPGECLLSTDDPSDPSAVICPHVDTAAVQHRETGYLHILKTGGDKRGQARSILPLSDHPILVTEGGSDTLYGYSIGFVCVGTPAAGAGIDSIKSLVKNRTVVIVGDSGQAGETGLEGIFVALESVCESVTKILPPEGLSDLREWSPTQEELLAYIEQHGDSEATGDVLADPSPLAVAEKWLKTTQTLGGYLRLRRWKENWYRYHGGRYEKITEDAIDQMLYGYLGTKYIQGVTGAVPYSPDYYKLKKVRHAMLHNGLILPSDEPFFIKQNVPFDARRQIIFKNGILNVETMKFESKSANLFTTTTLPYDYDPDATAKLSISTAIDVFNADQQCINLYQEWCGYLTIATDFHEKIMMFLGAPGSGKSTLTDMIQCMLGKDRYEAIDLGRMGTQFGLGNLAGKYAAIVGEAAITKATDSRAVLMKLKQLSGQDEVSTEKKYEDAVTRKLFSRVTYITNDLPYFPDSARALRRRVLLLDFPNCYEDSPDTSLKDRLPAEAQGFANWAIEGLQRLLKNGKFTRPDASLDALQDLKMMTSPLAAMVDECCQFMEGARTGGDLLFDLHKAWYDDNGHHLLTRPMFNRQMRNAYPHVKKQRVRNDDGLREYMFIGIEVLNAAKHKYLG